MVANLENWYYNIYTKNKGGVAMEISKDITIGELLAAYPSVAPILMQIGMG